MVIFFKKKHFYLPSSFCKYFNELIIEERFTRDKSSPNINKEVKAV